MSVRIRVEIKTINSRSADLEKMNEADGKPAVDRLQQDAVKH